MQAFIRSPLGARGLLGFPLLAFCRATQQIESTSPFDLKAHACPPAVSPPTMTLTAAAQTNDWMIAFGDNLDDLTLDVTGLVRVLDGDPIAGVSDTSWGMYLARQRDPKISPIEASFTSFGPEIALVTAVVRGGSSVTPILTGGSPASNPAFGITPTRNTLVLAGMLGGPFITPTTSSQPWATWTLVAVTGTVFNGVGLFAVNVPAGTPIPNLPTAGSGTAWIVCMVK